MRLAARQETIEYAELDQTVPQRPERRRSWGGAAKVIAPLVLTSVVAAGCGSGKSGSSEPYPGPGSVSTSSQPPAPKTKTFDLYHAGGTANIAATGASVSLRIERPIVGKRDSHSLSELALRTAMGDLEIGWTVDPAQFRDANPHLFVFPTKSQQTPEMATCYNACGFKALAGAAIHAGDTLPVGETHRFGAYHSNAHKEWELFYDNKEFGFVPDSELGDLGSHGYADSVAIFGEVIADHTPPTPCTQMGDGKLGKADSEVASNPTYRNAKMQQETMYLAAFASPPDGRFYQAEVASDGFIHIGGPGAVC
ncbi:MAG TPA: neprosin family prolyl endopeptidase [Candidatus Saccharimonadia bacterium]|nr:neprosin family prolyl endopeptidase [Candidatus Saccharimonadia bacterium]